MNDHYIPLRHSRSSRSRIWRTALSLRGLVFQELRQVGLGPFDLRALNCLSPRQCAG